MMFERDSEYLANLGEKRLLDAIKINGDRYNGAEPGTEPFKTSEERLAVFVPEAVRRGLAVGAFENIVLGQE